MKRQSAYAAKPSASRTSSTVPYVVPASSCSAPCRLVALPPSPSASFSARRATIPYETPFATSPARARGSSQSRCERTSANASIRSTTAGHRFEVLRQRVFGPRAALGRREPAALRGDRPALHAIRRGDVHGHRSVAALCPDLVDLRRAEIDPHLRDLLRHAPFYADVVRLVVARLVARREDRRELVERE